MLKVKRFFNLTMQYKITLCLCIFIIMPVVMFFLFSNFQMRSQKKEDIMQYSYMSFEQIRSRISGEIDYLVKNVYMFAYNGDLKKILSNAKPDDDISKKMLNYNYISSSAGFYDNYSVQVFVDDSMICSKDPSKENMIVSMKCLDDSYWYNQLVGGNYQYYFFVDTDDGSNDICIAHRISSDYDISETVGVVRFWLDASSFINMISANTATENTVNCIVNRYGKVIYMPEGSDRLELENRLAYIPYSDIRENSLFKSEDRKNIYIGTAIESTDWKLISIIPKSDINTAINRTTVFWIIMALLLCVIASVAAKTIVNSINRPIAYLSHEIDSGRNEIFDPDQFPPDIKPIVLAYNNDLRRIKNLIKESYEIRQQTRHYGIELLNMQIHPHFLYNALNMLHWEAKKQNCTTVEEGIEALVSFLRISIERKDEIVPLSDEIEHVRGYMKIQNMRYENFVEFEVDVPDEYLGVNLPCFTLQPLVENAINHGILLKNSETGKIRIIAKSVHGDIFIQVSDDGIGIDEDKLKIINYELHDGVREVIGIGLYDVNMRLRLFFGVDYYLKLDSSEKGTTVTVRVPQIYNYEIPKPKEECDYINA